VSPIDQVLFGREYDVPDLLILGYTSLCQNPTPLSYEEGKQLGMKEVIGIYQLRYELYGLGTRLGVSSNEVLDKVRIYMSSRTLAGDTTAAGRANNLDHSDFVDKKTSTSDGPASAPSLPASNAEPDKQSAPACDGSDPQQGAPEVFPASRDRSEPRAPNPDAQAPGMGLATPSDTSDDIHGETSEDGEEDDLNNHSHRHQHPGDWWVTTETTIPSGSDDGSEPKSTSSTINDDLDCLQTPPDVPTIVEGIGVQDLFEGGEVYNTSGDSSRATSVVIPDPSEVAIQALLNSLTKRNIDSVSSEIIKRMESDSEMVIVITRVVAKKVVEEVGWQSGTCRSLCNMIISGGWNIAHSNGDCHTAHRPSSPTSTLASRRIHWRALKIHEGGAFVPICSQLGYNAARRHVQ
jgi:hypothetical protein